MHVPEPAPAALRHEQGRPFFDHFADQLAGLIVLHHGPARHVNVDIGAATPVALLSAALAAVFRAAERLVIEVEQRSRVVAAPQVHAAAVTAVAAVRPAERNELLAAEGRTAVPAVAGEDLRAHPINKGDTLHNQHPLTQREYEKVRSYSLVNTILNHLFSEIHPDAHFRPVSREVGQ